MRDPRRSGPLRGWALQLAAVVVAAAAVALAGAIALGGDGEGGDAGGAVTSPGDAASPPPTARTLSNERTRSRWAHVLRATPARRRPDAGSPQVMRLTTRTSDRTPELVLALSELRRPNGSTWVRVRLPMRPNNSTGWVPRARLGRYYAVTTFMRVDRARLRATLYDRGSPVWQAQVAVGTRAAPTPAGSYYVRNRIRPNKPAGTYGVFAFGTNGYSPGLSDWPGGGVIGIHGTDEPQLIPGRVSHGCVRVENGAIARLRRLMPLGTPIEVV